MTPSSRRMGAAHRFRSRQSHQAGAIGSLSATAIRAFLLLALGIMAGCTHTVGHDFARPDQVGVVPGQATEADILGRYGPPSSRSSTTRAVTTFSVKPQNLYEAAQVPGTFTFLRYNYVQNQAPIDGGDMNQKAAIFTFWNGTLVGYDFSSSFTADSSDFDEETAKTLLASRQTTREDLIAQLGKPGGRFTYPLTPTPGTERLHYSYQKFDVTQHQRQIKTMDVVFNAAGQVLDYRASSAMNPFAPAAPPASGVGLLFLPRVRASGGHR